jgi:DNA-binding transcriptional regulator YdaS (Cro superfamily)
MPLGGISRKILLPHGKQRQIARRLGVSETYVSNVVAGVDLPTTDRGWKTYRRVQAAIARALRMRVNEAFSSAERGVVEEALVA